MPKDSRTINPAAAALRASKQKEIKKSRHQVQQQRAERQARRNPERLRKQIDELNRMRDAQGGALRPKDKDTLAKLETEVKGIRKAREAIGDKGSGFEGKRAPGDGRDERRAGQMLGKRGRGDVDDERSKRRMPDNHRGEDSDLASGYSSGDTDPEIRAIPMPRDPSPPIPPRWIRDRERAIRKGLPIPEPPKQRKEGCGMIQTESDPSSKPAGRPKEHKKIYSAAPQVRDLEKEATSRFVPAPVLAKMKTRQKPGDLAEPEEQESGLRRSEAVVRDKEMEELERELAVEDGEEMTGEEMTGEKMEGLEGSSGGYQQPKAQDEDDEMIEEVIEEVEDEDTAGMVPASKETVHEPTAEDFWGV